MVVLTLFPFFVGAQVVKIEVFIAPSYTFAGEQTKQEKTIFLNPAGGNTSVGESAWIVQEKYQGRVGIDIGALAEKTLTKKFSIKSGISFSLKRLKRTEAVNYTNETFQVDPPAVIGSPIGFFYGSIITRDASGHLIVNNTPLLTFQPNDKNVDKVGETKAFYLQIPISIGYRLGEKITLEGGAHFSILVAASAFEKSYTSIQNQLIQDEGHWNTSTHALSPNLLNVSTRISYQLNRHLRVHAEYQRSISAIYKEEKQLAGRAKFNTTNLGISYVFKSKIQPSVD